MKMEDMAVTRFCFGPSYPVLNECLKEYEKRFVMNREGKNSRGLKNVKFSKSHNIQTMVFLL
jgi:hypothetical protein